MVSIMSSFSVSFSPVFALNCRLRLPVLVRTLGDGDSELVSPDSGGMKWVLSVARRDTVMVPRDPGNKPEYVPEMLKGFWDDGYGTQNLKDYAEVAGDMTKPDGGPPRWFCPVSCGRPLKDSPVLLFLPGIDGVGTGLVLHEKALGRVFEVRCLHIPVWDRTPYGGLIQIVEEALTNELASSSNKPIYLVGDSFGGCLALAVAARNPTLDLILILANPATSFESLPLQPLFPLLKVLPEELVGIAPFLLSSLTGNQMKMATVDIESTNPSLFLGQLSTDITGNLLNLLGLGKILPKETLLWKLKQFGSAAAYANSRLGAITAEVLVLASGKDNLLPSKDEAQRLSRSLQNCKIRVFEDSGHTILLENGVNLLTVIKGTMKYRRSLKHDLVTDFLPPSMSEYRISFMGSWWFRLLTGVVMLSTMEDGKIVKGLAGIPDEGPVLLVSNHMIWGIDIFPLISEFLRQKNVMLRCLAHPELLPPNLDHQYITTPFVDMFRVFGALPVTARSFFKLFATKSYTLLYPGGVREALHRKGEAYKLFWPEKEEFVRMAANFGATIIPFGVVGEDDVSELLIDYNEIMSNPVLEVIVREFNKGRTIMRQDMDGEIANQLFHFPIFLPKLPGRLYYLFGKPIQTKGMEKMLEERGIAQALYLQIKCEVEKNVAYLLEKREADPYRGFMERVVYHATHARSDQIPTFEP